MKQLELSISDSCECKKFHWVVFHWVGGADGAWCNTGRCGIEDSIAMAAIKGMAAYEQELKEEE